MTVIGITGGSGAGKSLACQYLQSRGGRLIDCDKVYASLVDSPSECTEAIAAAFGREVLKANGALDRSKLSEIVFKRGSKDMLELLNKTVHPAVIDEVEKLIGAADAEGIPYVLVDAPQLFEAGADRICDCTVFVTADKAKRIERILSRDTITLEAAVRRIDSQLSDSFFENRCSHILHNNGTERQLEQKCNSLLDLLGIQ